jgi:hypothetical protein
MIYNEQILKQLDDVVSAGVGKLPYTKGGDIYIEHSMIQKARKGFVVFDTKEKIKVSTLGNKVSAIAVAVQNNKGHVHNIRHIEDLDRQFSKHYMDILFHKHTISVTKDEIRREITETRLDIALNACYKVREEISNYLYDK